MLINKEMGLSKKDFDVCGQYEYRLISEYSFLTISKTATETLHLLYDGDTRPGIYDQASLNVTLSQYHWLVPIQVYFIDCSDSKNKDSK